MNFLLWRLHRNQVYLALGLLAGLTILLLITGWVMADDYRTYLAGCGSMPNCHTDLYRGDGAIIDIVNFTVVVPLLFGVFWGVPIVAKECEEGTLNLAWTQGVSRRQWLRANVLWVLLAAALWGGALAALVSWWRTPENGLDSRFLTGFDIQGIVPVAYALFAVALGLAVGALLRRVLPAIAVTLTLFVAIRVAIGVYLRPHYMAALTKVFPLSSNANVPAGSWTISSNAIGPHGVNLGTSFAVSSLPAACQHISMGGLGDNGRCLAAHGFHQVVVYQPASRFWAFQGIEAGIFVALAVGLVAFTFWRVLSRDA